MNITSLLLLILVIGTYSLNINAEIEKVAFPLQYTGISNFEQVYESTIKKCSANFINQVLIGQACTDGCLLPTELMFLPNEKRMNKSGEPKQHPWLENGDIITQYSDFIFTNYRSNYFITYKNIPIENNKIFNGTYHVSLVRETNSGFDYYSLVSLKIIGRDDMNPNIDVEITSKPYWQPVLVIQKKYVDQMGYDEWGNPIMVPAHFEYLDAYWLVDKEFSKKDAHSHFNFRVNWINTKTNAVLNKYADYGTYMNCIEESLRP